MKKIIFLLHVLIPCCVFSQFSDNFSDGCFQGIPPATRSVEWSGDGEKFIVNTDLRLQLNAPTTGSPAQLRTASALSANAYWEWWMKLDFNPTSSNYAKVFLCSDESDLTGDLNGLFIRVGYTNKNLCLVSQKGKTTKVLIEGTAQRLNQTSSALHIQAKWDKKGTFSLYSKFDDESEYVLEGTCSISDVFSGNYFGTVCYFSSTRNKSFYFDDFLVRELRDDEQGDGGTTNPDLPEEDDVVFSEIMANPGGTDPEYVELYNRSNKTFNLANCLYYYGTNSYKLPDAEIKPQEYFVLTKTTAVANFPEDVKVFGVTSFPTMANTGRLLMFGLSDGTLISWFEYSDKMYGSNEKKAGGWSLECIDSENKSNAASNWIGSDIAGGTPGRENSVKAVNPDSEIPTIVDIQTLENNEIKLTFSKPMNRTTLTDKSAYTLSDNSYEITALTPNYPQGTEVILRFSALPPQGVMIELELTGVKDRSGFELENKTVLLGSGYEATENEIVINEILFNPPTGGNEYVEIYNKSDKAFDLRFLSITSRKPSDGSFNSLYALATTPLLLQPQQYLVITKSKDLVCSFYECRPSSDFVELSVMPSLANTSGCAVLINNRTNEIIDEFAYNENMHTAGISNKKGIALERTDVNLPTNDPENWHSASAASGFGTPGYQNSQSVITGIKEGITVTYPEINSDNYSIRYRFESPGYRCRAYVYDMTGKMITVIANNELLGTEGELIWNGKRNSGQTLTPGIYLIYMEVYDTKGVVKTYKKPTVVK
ncbi:MAG: lamin tail domain-containing protein [Candidatus Azobacteroides sp.]|nr:lamin tail domain-containing protein [Candidatus Azobacteroides sp.]